MVTLEHGLCACIVELFIVRLHVEDTIPLNFKAFYHFKWIIMEERKDGHAVVTKANT